MAEVAKVTLTRADYEKILMHARKMFPEEACGLIGGIDHEDGVREIRKVYLLENLDHTRVHFTLDPREQLQAVRDMRANGLQPLGNWHSHPETPARQSEEDKRLSYDRRASYMILSLMDENHPVLRSFHYEDGASTEENLEIVDI